MKPIPERLAAMPVNEFPAQMQTPKWEQFPVEKREELIEILAGMLVRQAQEASHEQPS